VDWKSYRDVANSNSLLFKKFRFKKIFNNFFQHNIRRFPARIKILGNTFRLAPDRYLTVFGVFYLVGFVVVNNAKPMAHTLVEWEWASNIKPYAICIYKVGLPIFEHSLTPLISIILLAIFSLWPTYILCKRDAELYARILTDNMKTVHSIYFLSRIILKTMRKITNELKDRPKAIAESRRIFEVIELVKLELANRFELNARQFCDQFLLFSPSIFAHRIIKLGLNQKHKNKGHHPSLTYYNEDILDRETTKIKAWVDKIQERLFDLQKTKLDFNQLEALFKAESTSSSIQRLAYILQNSSLNESDLKLLFQILKAYGGRSLFQRLMAVTALNLMVEDEVVISNMDVAVTEQVSKRIELLNIASGEKATDKKGLKEVSIKLKHIYAKTKLNIHHSKSGESDSKYDQKWLYLWWEKTSSQIRKKRNIIREGFHGYLNDLCINEHNTIYIVVDHFSRAVRTSLRSLPEELRIEIMIINSDKWPFNFSSRLMSHTLIHESWVTNTGENKVNLTCEKRKNISGDVIQLKNLLQKDDCVLFITGASGIKDNKTIFTTSNITLLDDLEEACEAKKCSFKKIALCGIHKLYWSDFYDYHTQDSKVKKKFTKAGIKRDRLTPLHDFVTGGLYPIKVDTLISDVPSQELDKYFYLKSAKKKKAAVKSKKCLPEIDT